MEKKIIRLSANENYYGCAPSVRKVLQENTQMITSYPDFHQTRLKEKLALKCGVSPDNIMLGVGTVYIIDALIRFYSEPGDEILTFERSFVAYGQLSAQYGRTCVFAPLINFSCTAESVLKLITPKTKIIFIANPNNPTGTIIGRQEMEQFINQVPSHIRIVIDEAYNEYVTDPEFPETISYIDKYCNVIVLRGLSKVHGLAGLRIGYGLAEVSTAKWIESRRLPYSINTLSAVAAIQALDEEEFINKCAELNATERDYLYQGFSDLGYTTVPSQANYIFLYFNSEEKKMNLYKALEAEGIIVCNLEIFGQSNSLRIGVADHEVNEKIIKCAASVANIADYTKH